MDGSVLEMVKHSCFTSKGDTRLHVPDSTKTRLTGPTLRSERWKRLDEKYLIPQTS